MTTPVRKTEWTLIEVFFVLSSVLQFPVARGTLTPNGTVSLYSGSQQTFTCNVTGIAAVWTISGLSGISVTGNIGLSAANDNARITTTDTRGITQSSTITISGFTTADNGGTIQCINVDDDSVQGKATISIAQVQLLPKPLVGVRGQNLTVTCSFSEDTVVIELIFGNISIWSHPRYLGATLLDNTTVEYRFGPLEDSDDGSVFSCDNLDGSTDSATLDVQSQDVTISPEGQVVVAEGGSFNITCTDGTSVGRGDTLVIRQNGALDFTIPRDVNGAQVTFSIGPVTSNDNETVFSCHHVLLSQTSSDVVLHVQSTDFSTVSPTLIRKFIFPSQLAVVLLWSVPASVADDVDGFVISVVMVTPSSPKTIQETTAGKQVKAYGVYFPEKGASYQVTVHMTMNGSHSRPLTVEVNF